MSMRLLIGISLVCLVTSPCAIGKTTEKSASHYRGEGGGFPEGSGETPIGKSPSSRRAIANDGLAADQGSEWAERRFANFEPAADRCGGTPDPCCSSLRTTGMSLFGKAAWYNLVGRQTASGEILDTVTATAAHRSLPLASYAKVTNLNNGRAVVVKINDRGPYTRGRILDLSPRAADALDMKRAGVAGVAVEPLINQAAPSGRDDEIRSREPHGRGPYPPRG
jgi:rare lipoprotein A